MIESEADLSKVPVGLLKINLSHAFKTLYHLAHMVNYYVMVDVEKIQIKIREERP